MIAETEKPVDVYERLYTRCKERRFLGSDPFDGLNSRLFKALPFAGSNALTRLVWLQLVKRSPINLRNITGVPESLNPKGLALFISAECARFRTNADATHISRAKELAKRLMEISFETKNGIAWGYPFDWQSRAFFAPKGTPTIVPTAFAANSLLDLYELTNDNPLLEQVRGVRRFILGELKRPVDTDDELCFSYTPLDESGILNSSLLATEVLARLSALEDSTEDAVAIKRSLTHVIGAQDERGAWRYGSKRRHGWVDNFHTSFMLTSLTRISKHSNGEPQLDGVIEKGLRFWLDNFFLEDGTPKYFDTNTYPIDIHSAAAAIHGLSTLGEKYKEAGHLSHRLTEWALKNMLLENGGFAYQKKRFLTDTTEHMRWNNAWMAYALASYIEYRFNTEGDEQ